jgi:hypothetical protein
MGWARLDDGLHDHPKFIGLSLEAVGLWTLALTWAHRHAGASFGLLGHVPANLPARLAGTRGKRLAAELEQHHLWDAEGAIGGWVIHDYIEYLPAAERPATANEVRKARSEAGKRGAATRWQLDGKLLEDVDGKPMPPTRPEPNPNQETPLPRKRGTRLPDDWKPTTEDIEWQRSKQIPDVLARREFEKFGNYWRAKSGADAAKLDWSLTWHTWLLNAQERAGSGRDAETHARIAARQADPLASAR